MNTLKKQVGNSWVRPRVRPWGTPKDCLTVGTFVSPGHLLCLILDTARS